MDKERELSLMAPIKTTMMLLVVLYHSCVMWAGGGWFDYPVVSCGPLGVFALWLNTFHVPMFVFASGYVHSYLRRETLHYGSASTVLVRKARRLLLPCALVSLLWAAPIYGVFVGTENLAIKFLLMESPSQLWFLPMLFWCFAITEFIWKFFRGLILQPDVRVFSAVALLAIGSPIVSKLTGGAFQLSSACSYLILFYSGWVFRMGGTARFWTAGPLRFIIADLLLFAVWIMTDTAGGVAVSLAHHVVGISLRLLGCAMVLSMAGRLRIPSIEIASTLERVSFGVYLFHQQLVWIALSFLNIPDVPPIVAALTAFIFSLSASAVLTELLGRYGPTKLIIGKG